MVDTRPQSAPPLPPNPAEAPYLRGLNEAQRSAVEAVEGPVLVLAGAGTGKTRVLTTRLAHILVSGRARPGELLAVTFTNKAAQEMKERISAILGRPVEGWWLGTFHALAARMLRADAEKVGLKPTFTILDTDDQLRLLKQVLSAEGVDDKAWPARLLLSAIERWKDRGLTPERVSAGEAGDLAGGRLIAVYAAYQARLQALNACDFGDLLLHVLELFRRYPEVLAKYQQRFRYILVDEYQDTNVAQYLWLRLLAQSHRNLCCVGDDDQSIYRWRGAEVGNILRFEEDFPGARIIRLERNYRSTGIILEAASSLISHNEERLGKTLWTEDDPGEKLRLRGLWDGEAEARFVADEIEALQARGESLDSMAILMRTGAQTREFEERFLTADIPHRVVGGLRFYERQEIRDAMAYLRLVHSSDDDLAFERVVNRPKRGLGDATLAQLHRLARERRVSLFAAARQIVETDDLRPQARRALAEFVRDMIRWRFEAEQESHVLVAERLLDDSGYTAMLQADKTAEAPGRLENLKELVAALAEFDTLAGFLEHVSLVMERATDSSEPKVALMTLHAAKGLEFDTVFLPGWEDGLFPNQRALDDSGLKGLEEERRLAYVGLTRARKRALLSFAANRRLHGNWSATLPSRFLDELPEACLERESDQGLYGGAGGFAWAAGGGVGNLAPGSGWGEGRLSPGFERARQRGLQANRLLELTPVRVEGVGGYQPGTRVFHQKFGYGTVGLVEGDRLTIAFDKAGEKKVVAAFVVPADKAGGVRPGARPGRPRVAQFGFGAAPRRHRRPGGRGPAGRRLAGLDLLACCRAVGRAARCVRPCGRSGRHVDGLGDHRGLRLDLEGQQRHRRHWLGQQRGGDVAGDHATLADHVPVLSPHLADHVDRLAGDQAADRLIAGAGAAAHVGIAGGDIGLADQVDRRQRFGNVLLQHLDLDRRGLLLLRNHHDLAAGAGIGIAPGLVLAGGERGAGGLAGAPLALGVQRLGDLAAEHAAQHAAALRHIVVAARAAGQDAKRVADLLARRLAAGESQGADRQQQRRFLRDHDEHPL